MYTFTKAIAVLSSLSAVLALPSPSTKTNCQLNLDCNELTGFFYMYGFSVDLNEGITFYPHDVIKEGSNYRTTDDVYTECILPGPVIGNALNGSTHPCKNTTWEFSVVAAPGAKNLKNTNLPDAPDIYTQYTVSLWHTITLPDCTGYGGGPYTDKRSADFNVSTGTYQAINFPVTAITDEPAPEGWTGDYISNWCDAFD